MGILAERRRWRVRLRDHAGGIHGAGTMLDEDHVLTCAHVVEDAGGPQARLRVDFVGLPGTRETAAEVVPECWFPTAPDERGDIAVLRIARRQREAQAAPLHRRPLPDGMRVRAFGFPVGSDDGLWWEGHVVGEGGPGCEWVQLARDREAPPITEGFSGAAVLAQGSGDVVGMVVSRLAGDVVWMIPVETLLGYLPRWALGDPAVDRSLGTAAGRVPYDVGFAREFAGWLGGSASGVLVFVTGDPGSAKAAALELAVVLADRERAVAAGTLRDTVAPGAVPPIGSVDLAVDAAGKTADEIRRRIADRFGPHVPNSRRTVVVTAIDDAAEPDRLVDEVIAPLAADAGRLGVRLALGFRRETSPGLTALRTRGASSVTGRLAALEKQVAELAALEEHTAELRPRFAGEPEPRPRAHRRRAAVGHVRSAAVTDPAWAQRHLDGLERTLAADLEAARTGAARLDGKLRRRTELRFRLDGYGERAWARRQAEDPRLDELYGTAWRLLHEGPCDLDAAAAAVEEFGAAVREAG